MNANQILKEFPYKIYVGGPTNLWGDSFIKFKSDFYFKPPLVLHVLCLILINKAKKDQKKKKRENIKKRKDIEKKSFSPAMH